MGKEPQSSSAPGATGQSPHAAARFSEWDLNLVNAIQISPRAPWSRIGPALGVDAATAARHWHRLTAAGLAWTTAYAPEYAVIGWIQLRCRPEALAQVSERVCRCPSVYSIESTGGGYQLDLTMAAADLAALDDFTVRWLGSLPGVAATRVAVGLDMYVEGADWRPGALDRDERARLTGDDDRERRLRSVRRKTDIQIVAALGADARLSLSELAAASGASETTVRRRLAELLASGRLVLRCDMARQLAGWPILIIYRAQLPAEQLRDLGAAVAKWKEIRLCTATFGGDSNLIIVAWLHTAQEAIEFETRLSRAFPRLRITDRQISLRTIKRMGWILDGLGRAVEHMPIRIWT
ncbi:Lrp/AsnC family transcriptional regulator [Nocardia otitidiscaviarum]|uniref:Lrp/AsnC family transcriptional regulator n=1 Tax=Nocardia otitidiscaviarum TaxID=1823 RepID=A0A516NSL8_9NOCA|nr:Lrp/AsnC family transcriptional regulator [Nocardia otitidiscaviarum]MCP9621153.1 Lrp/AsnC family transcriptional regulator [Nocardia otitidiscaviarum]QDP81905.1 Lrp/AsnC family transcriptional regulator [Nocardia otitidiscaviarum]